MAKAARAPVVPQTFGPVEILDEVEQGTPEWLDLRLGIPTASCFSMVLAQGKDDEALTRRGYMRRLAGELLTGQPAESTGGGKILTAAMQRGRDMEPEAIEHYAKTTFGAELERVGFARRRLPSGRYVGCSPDALMNKRRKALEVKTMAPHRMIEVLDRGAYVPPEFIAQIHGTMLVCDIEEVDLLVFYRGMPVAPRFTIRRIESEIKRLSDAIEVFDHELHQLVKRVRAMGGKR